MNKTVNVKTTLPVRTVTPKLNGNTMYSRMKLNSGDILNCIMMRANVDEVLLSGEIIHLDRNNYNKINGEVPSDNIITVKTDGTVDDGKPKVDPNEIIENDATEDPKTEAKEPDSIVDDNDKAELPNQDTKETEEEVEDTETTNIVEPIATDAPSEPVIDQDDTVLPVPENVITDDHGEPTAPADMIEPTAPSEPVVTPKVYNNNNNKKKR